MDDPKQTQFANNSNTSNDSTDSECNLWIGWNNEDEKVFLNSKHLNRHIAVLGSTGSGKTVLCKSIIEEAILCDIPIIAIDPQGDLVRLSHLTSHNDLLEYNIPIERAEKYENNVDVAIFTPGTNDGIKIMVDPINSFPVPEDKLKLNENNILKIISGISSTIVSLFETSSKKEIRKMQHLVYKSLENAFNHEDLVTDKNLFSFFEYLQSDRNKRYLEENVSISIMKSYSTLIAELEMILEGPTGTLFRDGVPLDLELLLKRKNGKTPLNIFYLNSLEGNSLKQFFLSYLGNEIYSYMLRKGEINAIFFIDEVKMFLPPGIQKTLSKDILLLLLEQGRKYGLSMLMATQSPGKIDYQAFGQCNTRALGILTTKQDIEKIKDSIPDNVKDNLPRLESGNFHFKRPKEKFQLIKVRRLYTDHGKPVTLSEIRNYMSSETISFYNNINSIDEVEDDKNLLKPTSEISKVHEIVNNSHKSVEMSYKDVINLFSCEYLLTIHKKVGGAVFNRQISRYKIESQLVSGFLSAITSFFSELNIIDSLNKRSIIRTFSEDIGDKIFEIVTCEGDKSVIALFLNRKPKYLNLFKKRLRNITYTFETEFKEQLESVLPDENAFKFAGQLLDEHLGLSLLSPLKLNQTYEGSLLNSWLIPLIRDQTMKLADNEGVYAEEILNLCLYDLLDMSYQEALVELLTLLNEKVLVPIDSTRHIPIFKFDELVEDSDLREEISVEKEDIEESIDDSADLKSDITVNLLTEAIEDESTSSIAIQGWDEILTDIDKSSMSQSLIEDILKRDIIFSSGIKIDNRTLQIKILDRESMNIWGKNLNSRSYQIKSIEKNPLNGKKIILDNEMKQIIISISQSNSQEYIILVAEIE